MLSPHHLSFHTRVKRDRTYRGVTYRIGITNCRNPFLSVVAMPLRVGEKRKGRPQGTERERRRTRKACPWAPASRYGQPLLYRSVCSKNTRYNGSSLSLFSREMRVRDVTHAVRIQFHLREPIDGINNILIDQLTRSHACYTNDAAAS